MEPILFLLTFLVHLCTITTTTSNGKTLPKFPAILIFGDSTVDTGNNDYIITAFKANYRPYGHDFPGAIATGRFSNGKLVPDFVASFLKIKDTVPPFLLPNLSDNELRTGVSFASAGSGYDDLTTAVSRVIPVSKQPGYLDVYIERLKRIVGEEKAQKIISGALVIVSAGTNDFIFNFYDLPTRRLHFTISQYQDFLHNNLQNFVKELYNRGCRLMVITGIPPIGCLPLQRNAKSPILRTCIEDENSDAKSYNDKLEKLLPQLQASLPGSKILYADIFNPLLNMTNDPQKYGFVETSKGCCGTELLGAVPLCDINCQICPNRSQYMFWDGIHPSQSAYKYLSEYLTKTLLAKFSQINGS
ncbi:unnamed protein product [Ilex paraguariensis]|uniref:GDSL esterase/lipase n=1 Tax=Ilex paraguariensis TaxID=185542 RepID=A0ABC8T4M7_9AQUA